MKTRRIDSKYLTVSIQRFLRSDFIAAKSLRHLAAGTWRTYMFGGTIREILLKRQNPDIRDLDIVIDDAGFCAFKHKFERYTIGTNRFGGLRLKLNSIPVDAWALSSTWAFRCGHIPGAFRHRLPETTFLNLDSIVFEITPGRIRKRLVAEPFLTAVNNNVLDIVLQENPEPALAAIRSIRMHLRYDMPVSRQLAQFLVDYLEFAGVDGCIAEQIRHYHRVVADEKKVKTLWSSLRSFLETTDMKSWHSAEQLHLFENSPEHTSKEGRNTKS